MTLMMLFGSFRRIVLTSNNLLIEHARQIVRAAENDRNEIEKDITSSSGYEASNNEGVSKTGNRF